MGSTIGVVLLIIVGLVVVAAFGFGLASDIRAGRKRDGKSQPIP